MGELSNTKYGFVFGPARIEAVSAVEWKRGRGHQVCVRITTIAGRMLELYVSPRGNSIRVFDVRKRQELK